MSMTQTAFLRKADIPTNGQIQETIQKLGYDFKILSGLEKQIDKDGLECSINGHHTYFETDVDLADTVLSDHEADWIKPDITNQDAAISFVWGADFAASACIGLISLALIDHSNSLIYYMDDQMNYSREMLLTDTPQFLAELQKQSNENHQEPAKSKLTNTVTKDSFWNRLKNRFK